MEAFSRLWSEYRSTIILVAVLATVWLALRSPSTAVDSPEDITAQIGQGEPVVLYLFSNT